MEPICIIAGPCMLESLEIGLEIGHFLKTQCSKLGFQYVFKSSFDKANRTSAKGERGPGLNQGLIWLKHIKNELNVPILTDVHEVIHVEAAHEIVDVLQIPAFLTSDHLILSACAKLAKTIHVKKGQHSSVEDLLFAAETLKTAGAKEIWLCERGTCFGYQNLVVDFRNLNLLLWSSFRAVYDCTHSLMLPGAGDGASSGLREHIEPLALAAGAIGIRTFFMEVHPNPAEAKSDRATQLTPKDASRLLEKLQRVCLAI